jgi:hypothetical protein
MKYAGRNKYIVHEDNLKSTYNNLSQRKFSVQKKQHVLSSVLVSMGPAIARNNQYKTQENRNIHVPN